jgi:LPXTG-motif cell wall-anchored protein
MSEILEFVIICFILFFVTVFGGLALLTLPGWFVKRRKKKNQLRRNED